MSAKTPALQNLADAVRRHGSLLENITWLGAAGLAVKPLWLFFVTVLTARLLGAADYGRFTTALSLSGLAFSFVGLGMEKYIVREVAGNTARAATFFTSFGVVRMAMAVVGVFACYVAGVVLDYDAVLLSCVAAAALYQAAQSFQQYCFAFYQALEVLRVQALAVVTEKTLVIVLGGLLLIMTGSAAWTLAGMAVGMAVVSGANLGYTGRRLLRLSLGDLDFSFLKGALREALPFAVISILGMVFYRVDTLMVEAIQGVVAAGRYGLAFRLVEALNIVLAIVVHAAAYPRLARLYEAEALDEVRSLIRVVIAALLLGAVPVAYAMSAFSEPLIRFIANDASLLPAADALRWLSWAFPFTCVRNVFFATLLVFHQQRYTGWVLFVGVSFNIGLNAALLPRMGIPGAAVATLASEALVTILYVWWYRRTLQSARPHTA